MPDTMYLENGVLKGKLINPRTATSVASDADASALTIGDNMFSNASNLESWTADMPALTSADSMFANDTALITFEGSISNLENGESMFDQCELDESSVLAVLGSIPTYTSGSHSISIGKNTNWAYSEDVIELLGSTTAGDKSYKGWTVTVQQGDPRDPIQIRIDNLKEETMREAYEPGYNPYGNTYEWKRLGLDAYEYDSEKYPYAAQVDISYGLFIGGSVVNDCLISIETISPYDGINFETGITSVVWNSDLPSLTSAYHTQPASITIPTRITNLVWNGDLPNLMDGSHLFRACDGLVEFNGELPNLVNGYYMFNDCDGLTSWEIELPKLMEAEAMFRACKNLHYWEVDMPETLDDAPDMFSAGVTLYEQSVIRILNTLPEKTDGTQHRIHLGKRTHWNNSQTIKNLLGVSYLDATTYYYKGWQVTLGVL